VQRAQERGVQDVGRVGLDERSIRDSVIDNEGAIEPYDNENNGTH